jgi:hydrogenase nickel incorporation protein HypA/HybF
VERHAREAGAESVLRIELQVGASSGVEPDLLVTAWEMVRETDLCRSAEIVIERMPMRWVCALCRTELGPPPARCEECDVPVDLDGGDELLLTRVDIARR